uniref:Uncharacterized protein n=1 Tax=Anguilla anguilla TaxID=7936 RepID=A0A0E9SWB5_ANGAN
MTLSLQTSPLLDRYNPRPSHEEPGEILPDENRRLNGCFSRAILTDWN